MSLDDKQVVWTDGACTHNQDPRFRRAGSGIYYNENDAMNWSGMLPGLLQSNQRAELFAVLVTCLRDPRPLDIRSDSEWVVRGVAALQSMSKIYDSHQDLWHLLERELQERNTEVCVSWVKGHAKEIDIERGRTTKEDRTGKDGADSLAVAGASSHSVPSDVVWAAKRQRFTSHHARAACAEGTIQTIKHEDSEGQQMRR